MSDEHRALPVILRVVQALTEEERRILAKVGSPAGALGAAEKAEVEATVERLHREGKIQLIPVSGEGILVPDVCAERAERSELSDTVVREPSPPIESRPIPRLTVLKGGVS